MLIQTLRAFRRAVLVDVSEEIKFYTPRSSWGRLGGSWGRLGGSWGRLGGSWAARSKKVSVHLFILAYFCLHFGTFLEDLEGLETTLKGIKTREDKKSQ